MDITPNFNLPSTPKAEESTTEEQARRDERHAQINSADRFRAALHKTATGSSTAAQAKSANTAKNADAQSGKRGLSQQRQEAFSPALMKLHAALASKEAIHAAEKGDVAEQEAVASENVAEAPQELLAAMFGPAIGAEAPAGATAQSAETPGSATTSTPETITENTNLREQAHLAALAAAHSSKGGSAGKSAGAKVESGGDSDAAAAGMVPQSQQAALQPGQVAPTAERAPIIPSALLDRVVEFATVTRNSEGFMEFQMGMAKEALGGLKIKVTAYGNRKVGLKVKSGGGEGGIGEQNIADLIEALKSRDVEVVDVVME